MDTHQYWAFFQNALDTPGKYCDYYGGMISNAKNFKYEVWVGEWSLATDACATWLGGFNDGNVDINEQGHKCVWVDCPKSYLPEEYAVDFDRTASVLGPFGEGNPDNVNIHEGKCSTDSDFFTHSQVAEIGKCTLDIFDQYVGAQFLWTAHNEIEATWDYIRAWDLGWINTQALETEPDISSRFQVNPAQIYDPKKDGPEMSFLY